MQADKYIAKEIANLTQEIDRNPKNATAYQNRGHLYHQKHEYDKAIKDFSKSIELEKNIGAYYNRGEIYSETGEYANAIIDFTEVIILNMEWASNNNVRGDRDKTDWDYFANSYSLREDAYHKLANADLRKAKGLGYSGTKD
jgi:tetratricopeptide (TPR) repeat protein